MPSKYPNKGGKCPVVECGWVVRNLRGHMQDYHKLAERTCKYCQEEFHLHGQLIRHERNNCPKRPLLLCSECGKGFQAQTSLKRHEETHKDQRKLKCTR